jgi:phage gpG-like protein
MKTEDKIRQVKAAVITLLLNDAVNWTLDNYKKEQWSGAAWAARKKETRLSSGKPLLVSRRNLYNAIRVLGANTFGVVGIPYARIHNEGGTITHPARTRRMTFKNYKSGARKGKTLFAKNNERASFSKKAESKAYTITIPQRKFIGVNDELKKYLTEQAKKYIVEFSKK